jgi:hypothetical protein
MSGRPQSLSTETLNQVVSSLQDRFRRHLGRYPKIAEIGDIPIQTIYKLTHNPPETFNWKFDTLRNLERGLDAYERHIVEELTSGANSNH